MNWSQFGNEKNVEDYLEFFKDRMNNDTEALLKEVIAELNSLYVRYDNDQEGRGVVGDVSQNGTISALEAVRAECLVKLGKI